MSNSALNLEEIRNQFPILNQEVHGKPLIYLDSAASAQKPLAVLDAMDYYYRNDNANVHRGAHTLGDRATLSFEGARDTVQTFINAQSRHEIIWTKGATEAVNLIASGLSQSLKEGDEIIVSRMEHHANIVPWQMAAQKCGAIIRVLDINEQGELDVDQLDSLLNERSKVLALTHVSNVLGTINPVKSLIKKAQTHGVITVIDGAQAVPHFQVDVQDLDCDFYIFSSHKLFGPTGLGVLYGKTERLEALPPYQGGGEMIERVSFEGTSYNVLPYKFEAGTPAISEVIGFAAAINYLTQLDRKAVEAHEQALLVRAHALAKDIPGMRIIGTAKQKVPVVSFEIKGLHPSDIGTLLDQQGIGIRTGHHCAMPLMEYFKLPGTARASFAFYNTLEEVDQLFAGLAKIQRMFA
ncbi:MAG: cysteine desulfurase/selenocysteine lyase [Oleiphilaceae bacterium]|jgi:cysteine desulfurase/selenocysteine lyase